MKRGKPLLVLDINGVLCYKHVKGKGTAGVKSEVKGEKVLEVNEKTTFKAPSYRVTQRPHLDQFLGFCFEHYNIGFLSSTTFKNANHILQAVLSKEQFDATLFCWYRDHTHFDPDYKPGQKGVTKFETVKYIADIYNNPVVNYNRVFHPNNVLLVDDSEQKTRFNPAQNIILVSPYTGSADDNELQRLLEELPARFAQLQQSE
jgi:hypothetical protein